MASRTMVAGGKVHNFVRQSSRGSAGPETETGARTDEGADKDEDAEPPACDEHKPASKPMLGSTYLSTRFPKSYIAKGPVRASPLLDMNIGKTWHLVRVDAQNIT